LLVEAALHAEIQQHEGEGLRDRLADAQGRSLARAGQDEKHRNDPGHAPHEHLRVSP
jgi:hypothetical protein